MASADVTVAASPAPVPTLRNRGKVAVAAGAGAGAAANAAAAANPSSPAKKVVASSGFGYRPARNNFASIPDAPSCKQLRTPSYDANDTLSWSPGGSLAYLSFVAAAACYFYVRSTEMLRSAAGVTPYGAFVLAVEALGASSVLLYGLCIVRRLPGAERAAAAAGTVKAGTHVHVLVPCYTESLAIVAETVWAAADADLPAGAGATVWLLDDGADPAKREWVEGLNAGRGGAAAVDVGARVRYLSGRAREENEANGKAANLNNALEHIFGKNPTPRPTDCVAVFDADQVAEPNFFARTLPALAASDDTALVLTPQRFANVDDAADIFNHSNRHFWEAMIPGLTAWGMVVCTGTNLVLRADALARVGWFPTSTVTEDYLLGMNLKAAGLRARYLPEYLATGEAPEDGAVFRQRSRWCKGHLQALFSRRDCPLLRKGLSLTQRLLYSSGAWAYAAAALTTPALASVPIAALAFDALPFAITPRLACAFVPYFAAVHAVVYWCDAPDLLRALWFGGVATRLLWWTYLKALVNTALWSLGLKRKMAFKTTAKAGVESGSAGGAGVGGGKRGGMPSKAASSVSTISSLSRSQRSISDEDAAGPSTSSSSPSKQKAASAESAPPASMLDQAPTVASVRDLWAPMALMAASLASAAVGLRRVANGEDSAALDVSIAWACYNALPPLLLAHYAWLGRGASLRGACGMAMAACAAVLAGAAAAGYLFLPPHIRGESFGMGRGYYAGGASLLSAGAGPRAAYYGDAILGVKAAKAAANATAALRTTLG